MLVDLVKYKMRKLLKTKFSIGEGTFAEGRWMLLSKDTGFVGVLSIVRVHCQRNVLLLFK